MSRSSFLCRLLLLSAVGSASPWVADDGDGTYRTPILHSEDLVSWELIGHVYATQPPLDFHSKPQHGSGCERRRNRSFS